MKICIYGAGAIGGYIGGQMSRAGFDVSLIARGEHLTAMRAKGLKLLIDGEQRIVRPRCTSDPTELEPQDYVFVTLKAPSVASAIDGIGSLLHPQTTIVWGVNGIPWWYFFKLRGAYENHKLLSADPGSCQWNGIGPERIIGCVVYPAAEVVDPGTIKHVEGNRFPLGEPSGERTERVLRLSQAMEAAGLRAPIRENIRDEIWLKLWGNLSFNPISALTGATLDVIATEPEVRSLARNMMLEAKSIAEKLGVSFRVDVERRIAGAAAVGAHKTSMLQDLERGRELEIDALVSAVQELGHLVNEPTPCIDAVLALVRLKAQIAGCYRDPRMFMEGISPYGKSVAAGTSAI